jgi:hypothetical protein
MRSALSREIVADSSVQEVLTPRRETAMDEQKIELELEESETERTEQDLEKVTEWARTCMFEGM